MIKFIAATLCFENIYTTTFTFITFRINLESVKWNQNLFRNNSDSSIECFSNKKFIKLSLLFPIAQTFGFIQLVLDIELSKIDSQKRVTQTVERRSDYWISE